jgi:hypothetical protein
MYTFAKAILLTVVLSIGTLGIIVALLVNDVNQASIPDIEQGTVLSKQALTNQTDYVINLQDGKSLYIQGNATLYGSIQENQTYVFDCRIDFNNHITIIDSATLKTP